MGDITVTLTREEVVYIENLLLLDKLENISKMRQNGWSEEYANYIKTDETLYMKFSKTWIGCDLSDSITVKGQ